MTDTDRDLARLREHLEALIASNDRLYQQRHDSDQSAIKTALDAADKRLNSMNEFRLALADQTARMITRVEVSQITDAMQERGAMARDGLVSRIEAKIQPIENRLDDYSRTNWPLLISLLSILTVVATGLWLVLGLKIDTSIAPMALSIEQIKVTAASLGRQVDEGQKTRETQTDEIHRQMTALSGDLQVVRQIEASNEPRLVAHGSRLATVETTTAAGQADRRAAQAAMIAKLVEVETQFKMMSVVINLMKDDNHQMFGVLWSKTFPGVPLPAKSFRPPLYDDGSTRAFP